MRPDVVERRVRRFDELLEILARIADTPWERFQADPEKYGSAERFLHLAIEALNDLGAHVAVELHGATIDRYRDIPYVLAEAGALTVEQRDVWVRIIGFRNVLVHDYLEVDRRLVYDTVQERLADLRGLMSALVASAGVDDDRR